MMLEDTSQFCVCSYPKCFWCLPDIIGSRCCEVISALADYSDPLHKKTFAVDKTFVGYPWFKKMLSYVMSSGKGTSSHLFVDEKTEAVHALEARVRLLVESSCELVDMHPTTTIVLCLREECQLSSNHIHFQMNMSLNCIHTSSWV